MSWQAHIITGFPAMFPGPLGDSLAGRALDNRLWSLSLTDLRDFGAGKHKNIDDKPAGGGAGMVLRADVAAAALDSVTAHHDLPVILPSPRGHRFTQTLAQELVQSPGAIFICNRFEGVDERFIEARRPIEVSLGDYVLSGGEAAALIMLDAIIRLLPGVMGKAESGAEESFSPRTGGLLEYPHYARPPRFEGREIPDIVTAGDHAKLAQWRRAQAEALTRARRPDLWEKYSRNKDH